MSIKMLKCKNKNGMDNLGKLTSLRIQIGELIKKAHIAGLHGVPLQCYNKIQNKVRKNIIKDFAIIEDSLLDSLKWQEYVYNALDDLLNKFINNKDSVTDEDVYKLILNTDIGLLYAKIPLTNKINSALEMLSKKVIITKKTMLDIYYIHRSVEVESYRIWCKIPLEINIKIIDIIDKYFTVNPSYATSKEYYLLKQISDAKNFDDAYDLYYENMDLLLDVTFIKVNNGKTGTFVPIDLYIPFSSIENISENLYSPFYGGKVNCVSGMATQRTYNILMSQRNVSLDANTVSYVRTMVDKGIEKLSSEHIKDLISNINVIKNASTFDYLPYVLENYIFSPNNEERIMQTVKSVESYFYPNDEWYNTKCAEQIKLMLEQKESIELVKEEYFINYALLLLICYIYFKFDKTKTQHKLEKFCSYMDTKFYLFREPFVEMAFNYFEQGNQYRFFKKIQRNATNMIKDLKNMAWDVFHLWSLEAACSSEDERADLLIPYFYCFDKGLLELKECFDLETLFVNHRTGERICFYHKHSYPIDIIEKYKSIESERIRRAHFTQENIMSQIEILENELNSLW